MTKLLYTIAFIFGILGYTFAQGPSFGIKAGMNLSSIKGPLEMNAAGEKLETSRFIPGFHLGPTLTYEITDKIGFKVELLYTQKGTKYRFENQEATSHFNTFFIKDGSLDPVNAYDTWALGKKTISMNYNTGFLELPLTMFYNITDNFRIGAGVQVGALLHATGTGELSFFSGDIQSGPNAGTSIDRFFTVLDYKLNKDKGGLPEEFASTDLQEIKALDNSLNEPLFSPATLGAYYLEPRTDDPSDPDAKDIKYRLFNLFDVGVNMELNYILNSGLYFSVRGSYGLIDATNDDLDYSQSQLVSPATGDFTRIMRDDKDSNVTIQMSVGFNF